MTYVLKIWLNQRDNLLRELENFNALIKRTLENGLRKEVKKIFAKGKPSRWHVRSKTITEKANVSYWLSLVANLKARLGYLAPLLHQTSRTKCTKPWPSQAVLCTCILKRIHQYDLTIISAFDQEKIRFGLQLTVAKDSWAHFASSYMRSEGNPLKCLSIPVGHAYRASNYWARVSLLSSQAAAICSILVILMHTTHNYDFFKLQVRPQPPKIVFSIFSSASFWRRPLLFSISTIKNQAYHVYALLLWRPTK